MNEPQTDIIHMDLTSGFPGLNGPSDLLQYSSEVQQPPQPLVTANGLQ